MKGVVEEVGSDRQARFGRGQELLAFLAGGGKTEAVPGVWSDGRASGKPAA